MKFRKNSLSLAALMIASASFMSPVYSSIPDQNMELFLELSVNGVPTYHVAMVDYKKPYYYLNEGDISLTPIQLDEIEGLVPGKMIPINAYEGVSVDYNEELQTLDIMVPAHWLPRQAIGSQRHKVEAKRSIGAIVNYDTYLSKTEGNNTSLNIWNELRFFGNYGVFSSSGTYSSIFGNNLRGEGDNYRRYDTFWEYSNEDKLYTARVGDLITRPLSWTSAARLGGLQLSHNFSLRPDLITYPLPEFSGEVGLPSTLDLMVNGNRYYRQNINPGPYDINQVTHLSGAGEAVVVTTDALGRTVSIDVPFYVTSQLLKKGLFDYTISAGSLREDYGRKNFSYSRYAIDASIRYGLSNEWTIEGHSELATSLQVMGIGIVTNIGRVGVINASIMGTRYDGKTGSQLYLGYEYQHPDFGVRASYRKRNDNYRDIASINSSSDAFTESMQLSFNKNFAEFGSVSVGYFATKSRNSKHQNTISLGWSKSLREYGSLYAYLNRSNDDNNKWTASVQWSIPLGELGSISASANKNDNKQDNYALSYSKAVPNKGGFGWRANYNNYKNQSDYFNAGMTYRNEQIQLEGGFYGTKHNTSYWADLSGAIVIMDKQVLAANSVSDSFVLVSTKGASDVDVKYENSVVGKTNHNGYLLVSNVPSYYDAKYEIDAVGLPFNMHADVVEQRISVKSGGGYTLQFPIRTTKPVTLALYDTTGKVIEIGSHVVSNHDEDSFVGWDGIVFFEYLEEVNDLTVALPNGRSCRVAVMIKDSVIVNDDGIVHLGNYTCH